MAHKESKRVEILYNSRIPDFARNNHHIDPYSFLIFGTYIARSIHYRVVYSVIKLLSHVSALGLGVDMKVKNGQRIMVVSAIMLGTSAFTAPGEASHFRGAAMVPSVDANGLLTVETTSFWRPTFVSSAGPDVDGQGAMTEISQTTDTSDSRFTVVNQVHELQLPGAGTFDIEWSGCCRVGGINNASESGWEMNSTIVYDGSTSNTPILFDFSAIQPEVVRGNAYNDNIGATSGNGGTLSYDQTLNDNINSQPPGFTIDSSTGEMDIPASNTNTYADNTDGEEGADYAFSGNIQNSDGSSVEFDWLFDAVDTGANLAPNVTNHVINALVGDSINQVITGTDPNADDDVTLSLLSFLGPGINLSETFTPGASGNPTNGTFAWDTSGSAPGTYIANIRGSDGLLTDTGGVTINLSTDGNGTPTVPEPGALAMFATGLVGLGFGMRRRRR